MTAYEAAEKILDEGVTFLLSRGFKKVSSEVRSSPALGETLVLTFASSDRPPERRRKLEFHYFAGRADIPPSMYVSIASGNGEFFNLEDWLRAKGGQALADELVNSKQLPDTTFLKRFIKQFEEISKGELGAVLDGGKWESIKFDWKGYR